MSVEMFEDSASGAATIELRGRLDADSAPMLQMRLFALIDSGVCRLVLDLAGVPFTNSVGLRVLLMAAKRVSVLGGRVGVCRPQPAVLKVLETAGFDRVLGICETREEAAAYVDPSV